MRLDVVARAGPHSSATPTARPEHVTAGGAARGSTRIEKLERATRANFASSTVTPRRSSEGNKGVSASRSSHRFPRRATRRASSTRDTRAGAAMTRCALSLSPFRRPRLPSIPLAFAPSRDPPAIVFRIRRISARPPTSAPLTFASPFPPVPSAGSISARWRRVTGARRPRRASAREARRRSSPAPTRPSARSRRR